MIECVHASGKRASKRNEKKPHRSSSIDNNCVTTIDHSKRRERESVMRGVLYFAESEKKCRKKIDDDDPFRLKWNFYNNA